MKSVWTLGQLGDWLSWLREKRGREWAAGPRSISSQALSFHTLHFFSGCLLHEKQAEAGSGGLNEKKKAVHGARAGCLFALERSELWKISPAESQKFDWLWRSLKFESLTKTYKKANWYIFGLYVTVSTGQICLSYVCDGFIAWESLNKVWWEFQRMLYSSWFFHGTYHHPQKKSSQKKLCLKKKEKL